MYVGYRRRGRPVEREFHLFWAEKRLAEQKQVSEKKQLNEDMDYRRLPVFCILDNIRSAGNVGSIFRTSDAVNLGGLYLCGMTATPPRPDIEKTALGATQTVPWAYYKDTVSAIREMQLRGLKVYALEQTPQAVTMDAFSCDFPVCFVVGHEVTGVNADALAAVDGHVEIPMHGEKKSLNVAVSFGVTAYELRRRFNASASGD
jgi:23S rRNA (guanosine2251-2'-O)-methyltransferase